MIIRLKLEERDVEKLEWLLNEEIKDLNDFISIKEYEKMSKKWKKILKEIEEQKKNQKEKRIKCTEYIPNRKTARSEDN